jgi:hypothetical protein
MSLSAWLAQLTTQPSFQWLSFVIGVVGTALTALGTVLTIRGWRADQRNNDAYSYLLRIADRHIDKELTEEEIARRQNQLATVSSELTSLRKHIETEIPLQARRAVLQDRLRANVDRLHETLEGTMEIHSELERLGQPSELYPELVAAVQKEITPDFVMEVHRANLKTYLTISAVVTAISSTTLPDPFRLVITVIFAVICIAILLRLVRHYIPASLDDSHIPMLYTLAGGLASGALISLIVSWLLFREWRRGQPDYVPYLQEQVTTSLLAFNAALFVVAAAVLVGIRYQSILARTGSVLMGLLGVAGLLLWTFVTVLNRDDMMPVPNAFGFFELSLVISAGALAAIWKANQIKQSGRTLR